jgi:predicted 2-oxoglutarate/Fe(II)-dependent dioxygenase YbiX
MEIGKGSSDNIVIVENFISNEHLEMAYRYCYSINEWESWSRGGNDKISTYKKMQQNAPELFKAMQLYVNKVQELIEFKFGRKLESAHPGIRRWDAGEKQELHADGENLDGTPNDTYIVDYGSIIYLNDNYVGGEIYFPQHGIEIKPKEGTLIFFPSSIYYLHGVKPIMEGVRYTSPHFWVPEKHNKLIDIAKNNITKHE